MKKYNIAAIAILLSLTGCTQQTMVRSFGGTMTIGLHGGEKLVNVTWKEDSIWTLTRPMREGEVLETYSFQESSVYSIMEGKVILVEQELGAKGGVLSPPPPGQSPQGRPNRTK